MNLLYNATAPTLTDGNRVEGQSTSKGELLVRLSASGAVISAGNPSDGTSNGIQTLQINSLGSIFNGTTWDRDKKATTVARLLSAAASTNATSVKASAGDVFKIIGTNTNAAARYLKLYNKASAPTVGTDTPVMTLYLPPSSVGGGVFQFDFGSKQLYFATGIAYALTTAAADADTGALTAGDVVAMNIAYA